MYLMAKFSSTLMGLLAAAALASSGMAFAAEPAMTKGHMLVDHKEMTLYTFDKDSAGKSACDGQCAENWPPLMAGAMDKADGKWTVVTRTDGSKQWAYGDKPLYTFKSDKKAGDTTGDGKGGVWHIANP
jgi:predicted lipoprotein with Yx(FWY)xxD motif